MALSACAKDFSLVLQWLSVIAVLFVGGAIISAIELPHERAMTGRYCSQKAKLALDFPSNATLFGDMESQMTQGNCRTPTCNTYSNGTVAAENLNWDFAGSCFFILSTTTTIGYGTYVPATVKGKAFSMVFALPGILNFLMAAGSTTQRIDELIQAKMRAPFNSPTLRLLCT
jgi:hypothetical protein